MKLAFKELAKGLLGDGLLKQVGDLADKFIPTGDKREEAKKQLLSVVQDYQTNLNKELTDRLRIDMNSDSWLSKNIRPMTLIFTTVMVTVFALTDGNIGDFKINASYIKLLETLMVLQYAFYFGSRGIEKVMTTLKNYNPLKKRRNKDGEENL